MAYTLEQVLAIIFSLGAVSSILPVFMLPGLCAAALGILVGDMYTQTAVKVQRLVASSQSPVFSQFSDSMAGLSVIRARGEMPQVFRDQLAERLRAHSRALVTVFNCNRWVSVRVDFVTSLVTVAAGMIAVSKAGVVPAGLVGFSLTNATTLSDLILGLVRASNELEVMLQSVRFLPDGVLIDVEAGHADLFSFFLVPTC